MFSKNINIELVYSPPRLDTGMGAVERAIQTLENPIIANLEKKIGLTESINRTLRVFRFKIHTGSEVSPFDLLPGKKPRTELTNIIKDNKSYLSDWTTLNVSVPPKQIPINVARNEKREVTDHKFKARKRKTLCCTSHKSPNRKRVNLFRGNFHYLYTFFEKNN